VTVTVRCITLLQKATVCVAFLFLLLWIPTSGAGQEQPLTEHFFKGLWVIRNNLEDSTAIDRAIDFAAANGFRQVLMQVRGRGYAFYNSEIVPKSTLVKDPDFDPLAYAVKKAHSAGLAIHAWINTYLLWSASSKPSDTTHLIFQHPEWTEADSRGVMDMDKDWKRYGNGKWGGIYLSPTHPKVNPYLLNVIQELVDNYDIDGIHLDYIRYQGVIYGYNPTGRQVFKNRFGVDPLALSTLTEVQPDVWDDRSYQIYLDVWNTYRRDKITDLIKEAKEICAQKGIQLSAAVKPDVNNARTRYFQDWGNWLKDGIIDFVVPMNYASDMDMFLENFTRMQDENIPISKVYMGIAVYNQSKYDVAEKILKTLAAHYPGFCLFSYDTFAENPSEIEVLRRFITLSE